VTPPRFPCTPLFRSVLLVIASDAVERMEDGLLVAVSDDVRVGFDGGQFASEELVASVDAGFWIVHGSNCRRSPACDMPVKKPLRSEEHTSELQSREN